MQIARRAQLLAVVGAGLAAGLAGCSRNHAARDVAAMNTSNIQRLANMYAAFQNYKGGRGPTDETEFKAFVKNYDPNKLSMMQINANDIDGTFTSERDGKPFQVKYRVGGGRGSVDPVIFEQEGKDGKKQVAFTGGKVDSVDDATYQQLWAGHGGHSGQAAAQSGPPVGAPGGGRASGRPAGAPSGPPGK